MPAKNFQLNLKNKLIIKVVLSLVIIFSITYFLIWPVITAIKKMSGEINSIKIDIKEKFDNGQTLVKLNQSLKEIEPKAELLNNIFIDQNRQLEFITTMEDIATENNIKQKLLLGDLQNINSPVFKKSTLKLVAEGTLNNLQNYLRRLESLNYYINIHTLNYTNLSGSEIATDGSGKNTKIYNLIVESEIYWK